MPDAVEVLTGGVSAFGVWTTRKVLGAVFSAGEAIGLSTSGLEEAGVWTTEARLGVVLCVRSSSAGTEVVGRLEASLTAAVMSNLPGCFRLIESPLLLSAILGVE